MKSPSVPATLLAGAAMLSPILAHKKHFVKLPLPGDRFSATSRLLPSRVIAAYQSEIYDYTCDAWNDFLKEKCDELYACSSTLGLRSRSDPERLSLDHWYGYLFSGPPTSTNDYVNDPDVRDSTVWVVWHD